jgi:AraC family transcriptional regulator of adaptative response/methylated-DNA-[protein]-cysteine methyltransferase
MQTNCNILSAASFNRCNENNDQIILAQKQISTPLGEILALADDKVLYYCDFTDNPNFEKKVLGLLKKAHAQLIDDSTEPLRLFEQELHYYFAGTLRTFTTPTALFGTDFTVTTWRTLQKIPYGKTISYAQLAEAVGKPTACRAVANANSMNVLPIIIPCHRVINANGELGGYNSGTRRKAWLLDHEK